MVAAGVGIWYYKTRFYVPDKGGMEHDLSDTVVSCTYSAGGGMDGGSMSMGIYLNEKNEVCFHYSEQKYPGAEEEVYFCQLEYEALDEIRQKCNEFGVLGWGQLDYSDIVILDAPTTTVSFGFGDKEIYSVSSNRELPKNGSGFFAAFYEILYKHKTQGGN